MLHLQITKSGKLNQVKPYSNKSRKELDAYLKKLAYTLLLT